MKKPAAKHNAKGEITTKLLVAMTGKSSNAKAAEGEEPLFTYIAAFEAAVRET